MSSGYRYLTHHDRCQIRILKKGDLSQRIIAAEVVRPQPIVSRELDRNSA